MNATVGLSHGLAISESTNLMGKERPYASSKISYFSGGLGQGQGHATAAAAAAAAADASILPTAFAPRPPRGGLACSARCPTRIGAAFATAAADRSGRMGGIKSALLDPSFQTTRGGEGTYL